MTSSNRKIRLLYLLLIASVAISFVAYFLINVTDEFSVSGRPVVDMFFLGAIVNLVVYIVVRTTQSLTTRLQRFLIGAFLLVQIAGFALFRLDGVYGNGRPKLAWRWNPPASSRNFELTNGKTNVAFDLCEQQVWPGYRGIHRDGSIDSVQLEGWATTTPKMKWAIDIGSGWSSFAIASAENASGACITQEQRGEFEAVVCYDISNGESLWIHTDKTRFMEVTAGEGPRATPTIDGEFVFAWGATGILNCLELRTGNVVWARNILDEFKIENRIFGMAGSPLIADGKVIVTPGGRGTSVMAFAKESGELVWQAGDQVTSYCSPQHVVIGDTNCVFHFGGESLSCRSLVDGTPLFKSIPWVSNPSEKNNVCQPLVVQSEVNPSVTKLIISSGYGQGSALFEIKESGKPELGMEATKSWHNQNLKSKFSSVIEYQGHVYGLDNGIMVCIDIATGKRCWKNGRYGHGQIIRIGDKILVQAEVGFVAIVTCNPTKYVETMRIDALESRTWNHPATDGRYLIVRNDQQAICFELRTVENQR